MAQSIQGSQMRRGKGGSKPVDGEAARRQAKTMKGANPTGPKPQTSGSQIGNRFRVAVPMQYQN